MMDYNTEQTKKMSAADKKAYGDNNGKERAEYDLHTLMDAKEIKADKKRYKRAMHCAMQKQAEMNNIISED